MPIPPPPTNLTPPRVSGYLAQRADAARLRAKSLANAAAKTAENPQIYLDPTPPHSLAAIDNLAALAALAPHPEPTHQPDPDPVQSAQKPRSPQTQPTPKSSRKLATHSASPNQRSARADREPDGFLPPSEERSAPVEPLTHISTKMGDFGIAVSRMVDPDAVVEAFARNAKGDPQVIAEARPHLPGVMASILIGAQMPGMRGDKDRTRLFRMLGLPWADPPRVGDRRGDSGVSLSVLAERLNRAHSRVAGRTSVTLTQSVTLEAADDSGSGEVARLFDQQARYPADAEDAPDLDDDDDAGA